MIFPDKAISAQDRERIHRAAKLGQLPTLRKIFAPHSNIPIDCHLENEFTPLMVALMVACMGGKTQAAALLLELRADPNAYDDWHLFPLMRACMAKKPAAALALARRGANVEFMGKHGETCIDVARKKCEAALADALSACIGLPAAMAERKAIEAQASPKAASPRKRAL